MASRSRQSRVWILPNQRTFGLVAVLVAMWYAGASQANGAAYLLCFVLTSLATVSIVHTWANLRGLTVTVDRIPPAFVGEEFVVPLTVRSERQRPHFALSVRIPPGKSIGQIGTLEPDAGRHAHVARIAQRRGRFEEVAITIFSSYPLGFFTARCRAVVAQTSFVYPAPVGAAPLPRNMAPTRQPRSGARIEGDDYGGLRTWREGESQRHIDWKAAARGQPLLTKQWTGEADEILRFDWESLAPLDTEARLSQMARWVVLAERGGASYELTLPGKTFRASRGDDHYHACLRALAEFRERPEEIPR